MKELLTLKGMINLLQVSHFHLVVGFLCPVIMEEHCGNGKYQQVKRRRCRYDTSTSKNWLQKLIRKIGKKNDSKNGEQRICRVEPFYSPEGGLYSAVLPYGTEVIEVWDVESHEKVRTYERLIESIGHEWFSKCPELAIAHTLKNIEDRTDEHITFESLQDATCYPEHLVFSSDGNKLASTGVWNAMILWDVESKKLHTTLVREGWIDCFTFLDNDNFIDS